MTARLALLRWVVRVVRKERRQHALVVGLVAFGIAVGTVLVSTAFRANVQNPSISGYATELRVYAVDNDPALLEQFDDQTTSLVDRHPDVAYTVSGASESRLVAAFGALMKESPLEERYELVEGTWPNFGQIVLTERARARVAAVDETGQLRDEPVGLGETVRLGGRDLTVSGFFEDRWDIRNSQAIVTPRDIVQPSSLRVFIPTLSHPIVTEAIQRWPAPDAISGEDTAPIQAIAVESGGSGSGQVQAAGAGYLVGTVLALQIAILASAGFTVLAQRRTRELAMLSAMGASPRRTGSVMRSTGLVVGAAGGLIGLATGVLMSIAITPLAQRAVSHRIEPVDLPWPYLMPMMPLAILTALLAAWWPARRIQKMSTIDAISARRPSNKPTTPPLIAGLTLAGAGTWLTIAGAPRNSPPLVISGVVSLVVGALMVVPAAVSVLGSLSGLAPLPIRVAWRDINRNRARSTAATAAAAIAIAVPFGLATFLASLSNTWKPSQPDNLLTLTAPFLFDNDGTTTEEIEAAITPLQEVVPDLEVLTFDVPIDLDRAGAFSSNEEPDHVVPYSVATLRQSGRQETYTAFANDDLLRAMDQELPPPEVDVLTTLTSPLDLPDDLVIERRTANYEEFPDVLLMREVEGTSTKAVISGSWYLNKPTAFSQTEMDRLEAVAAQSPSDLYLSGPNGKPPFLAMRTVSLAIAGLLGLSVIAVAVALIRTETEAETRALNAIGASPRLSRAIGAATAAGLLTAATAISVPATFALLAGVYLNSDEEFNFTIPWLELGIVLAALPAIAAAAGWALTTTKTKPIHS